MKMVHLKRFLITILVMESPEGVTSAEVDPSKDQLIVATNAAFEPFEFTKGDKYYGIDMEIAKLLADELGLELVINNMDLMQLFYL